jgi:hypothetical protein
MGIDPLNNISIIIRIHFAVTIFQQCIHQFTFKNRVILRNNNEKTPYELWKGSADNNLYIKVNQE